MQQVPYATDFGVTKLLALEQSLARLQEEVAEGKAAVQKASASEGPASSAEDTTAAAEIGTLMQWAAEQDTTAASEIGTLMQWAAEQEAKRVEAKTAEASSGGTGCSPAQVIVPSVVDVKGHVGLAAVLAQEVQAREQLASLLHEEIKARQELASRHMEQARLALETKRTLEAERDARIKHVTQFAGMERDIRTDEVSDLKQSAAQTRKELLHLSSAFRDDVDKLANSCRASLSYLGVETQQWEPVAFDHRLHRLLYPDADRDKNSEGGNFFGRLFENLRWSPATGSSGSDVPTCLPVMEGLRMQSLS